MSGTGTKKRAAFNSMIEDAKEHKFDLILTKEISRFARNVLDSIGDDAIIPGNLLLHF